MKRLHIAIAVTALALAVVREGHALDEAAAHRAAETAKTAPAVEQGGTPIQSTSTWQTALNFKQLSSSEDSITGVLDHISGDTYYAKFTNSSSDTYKVYYTITDGETLVQDETSLVVQGNSSNSNGPYHCSSNASLNIKRKEKL